MAANWNEMNDNGRIAIQKEVVILFIIHSFVRLIYMIIVL